MPTVLPGVHQGLKSEGNLDLDRRPVHRNPDGSVSTVRSMSFGTDRGEVLVPTVDETGLLSPQQAMQRYQRTGEHLGVFDSPQNADAYAEALHLQQAERYGSMLPPPVPRPAFVGTNDTQPSARPPFVGTNDIQGGTGEDDLSGPYLDQVNQRDQKLAVDSVRRQVEQLRQATPVGGPPGPPAPATGPAAPSAGQNLEGTAPPTATTGLGKAAAVAKDIGYGLTVEAAPAIVIGGRDAVQEAFDLADSVAHWVTDKLGVEDPEKPLHIPDPRALFGEPKTVTGGLIQKTAQFLVGWREAGKQLAKVGIKAGESVAGRLASGATRGALAGSEFFDPQEQKLGDVLTGWGLPKSTLTDFLSTSPDDGEAEGRLKNALSQVITGTAVDGLVLAARALRAARAARQAPAQPPQPGVAPDRPIITQADLAGLGDPTKPALTRARPNTPASLVAAAQGKTELGVPTSVVARAVTGAAKEAGPEATVRSGREVPPLPRQQEAGDRLYINFSRIDTPDDLQAVIDDAAQAFKGNLDQARRGTMTFPQIKANAETVDAFRALAGRRQGAPLNAEQSLAVRELWNTSASKLIELADVAQKNPSDANLFAFRRMLAIHHAIQAQAVGARTETARALASWRIPAGSDAMRAAEIERVLEAFGGKEVNAEFAQKIAQVGAAGDMQSLDKLVAKGVYARTRDAVLSAWINWGLLSGPKTHIVNTISNLSVVAQQMAETSIARGIARLLGDETGVQANEAMYQLVGAIQGGGKEGLRAFWDTLKTGESTGPFGLAHAKFDLPGVGTTQDVANIAATTPTGRWADVLRAAAKAPGRMLGAEDAYFKSIGYRMSVWQQAARIAGQEVAAGRLSPGMLKSRIADIAMNPPDEIKLTATKAADYQTFNLAPGKIASLMAAAKRQYPGLNILFPFVRTPSNIFNYGLERTPLAPALRKVRADLAAGGARQQLAIARMAMGTMIMQVVADMALNGLVTGRGPENNPAMLATLRRSGWQPYSIRIGDRYYQYSRFDPVGWTMGTAADLVELLHNTDWNPRDTKTPERVVEATVLAIIGNAMNKTYLQGLAQFVDSIANPDQHSNFLNRLAGSALPSGAAEFARYMDPVQREVSSMLDAARARTPALSKGLAPRRDQWGRVVGYQSGIGWAYDMFSPIYAREWHPEPIDRDIVNNGWTISEPDSVVNYQGAPIDLRNYPQVWSYYKMIRGGGDDSTFGQKQAVRDPLGYTLLDTLNGLVMGQHPMSISYKMRTAGAGGGREAYVRDTIAKFTGLARDKLLTAPIRTLPPELQAELSAFRGDVKRKLAQRPGEFQGMPAAPAIMPGVLP